MSGVSFTQVWLSLADRIITDASGMSSMTSRKGVGAGVLSSCQLFADAWVGAWADAWADAWLVNETIRSAVRNVEMTIRHRFNAGVSVASIVCTRISYRPRNSEFLVVPEM